MVVLNIVKKRAEDLKEVDLSLIKKDLDAVEALEKELADNPTGSGFSIEQALEQLSLSCSDKSYADPQWGILAGRLLMENIHLKTASTFGEATSRMKPVLLPDYYKYVMDHFNELNSLIDPSQDFNFDAFAVSTLRKSYLGHLKVGESSVLMETPQYMYLRVATYMHYPNMEAIKEAYLRLSSGDYAHASPTLFNAGMKKPQMASCFLMTINDDMLSIAKSWHDQAIISMNSGGIGADFSQLRHSEIGQHGFSKGIIPWLKITNEVLKAVDQGGKRKGSGTVYLRDCHVDIYEFVDLREEGPEDIRAKDLFLGLMVSDLFMSRVERDGMWSLFCPNKVKGLFDKWGLDFEMAYTAAEREELYSKQVRARDLWQHILRMQIKKGMPFILYIDACNRKSNQKHSGLIRSSNLCCEILEVTSQDEIASCNLASISLNKCVTTSDGVARFDFAKLSKLTANLVRNLNNVIDRNYYPTDIPEIKYSNLKHRPLGIGVQGLADAFAMLDISWIEEDSTGNKILSKEAERLNKQIFEVMYYSAVEESVKLAKIHGPYESFKGSPASKGKFQFDLWEEERVEKTFKDQASQALSLDFLKSAFASQRKPTLMYTNEQWDELRRQMMTHGMRNSLLIALMPTASSAHILGNAESFEPFSELIYARTVLSGQFMLVNKHLVKDLRSIGMWTTDTVRNIVNNRGSIQKLEVPETSSVAPRLKYLKLKYLTGFEIPQQATLQMSVDRGEFVCQTQSFNCSMAKPTRTMLNAYHFYGWKRGVKTGMYYLRQKASTDPINMSLKSIVVPEKKKPTVVCTDEVCVVCST